MSIIISPPPEESVAPDHTQLPDKDDNFVNNWQEPDQGALLRALGIDPDAK